MIKRVICGAAIAISLIGLGLVTLDVPPSTEEILRSGAFLIIAVFYGGLGVAMLLSSSILPFVGARQEVRA
jgi:hypothetical protein